LITDKWNLKGHDDSEGKSSMMKQPTVGLAHRVKVGMHSPVLVRGKFGKPQYESDEQRSR
jgi:hypothetical protein